LFTYTADTDKTRLSRLVRVGGVCDNCRQDKTVLSYLGLVSNFQVFSNPQYLRLNSCKFEIGSRRDKTYRNWVKTRQNCLVLSPIVFTPPTQTRQDKTVLSCPCRRVVHKSCCFSILWYQVHSHYTRNSC